MKIYTPFKATLVCIPIELNDGIHLRTFHLVVSNVAPSSGSTAGATIMNITGNYFSTSTTYPLVVNVGGQPCVVLSTTTTTIQCRTSPIPSSIASQYQGQFDLVRFYLKYRLSLKVVVVYKSIVQPFLRHR